MQSQVVWFHFFFHKPPTSILPPAAARPKAKKSRIQKPRFDLLRGITPLAWYDMPDAAARISRIASVARDDMDMHVHDGLSGVASHIHADVVPGGIASDIDPLAPIGSA